MKRLQKNLDHNYAKEVLVLSFRQKSLYEFLSLFKRFITNLKVS